MTTLSIGKNPICDRARELLRSTTTASPWCVRTFYFAAGAACRDDTSRHDSIVDVSHRSSGKGLSERLAILRRPDRPWASIEKISLGLKTRRQEQASRIKHRGLSKPGACIRDIGTKKTLDHDHG
jgi:hypothetical protein